MAAVANGTVEWPPAAVLEPASGFLDLTADIDFGVDGRKIDRLSREKSDDFET